MQATAKAECLAVPAGQTAQNGRLAAVQHFLRSFNILLKSVRLYGIDHSRTGRQLSSAWDDLYVCMKGGEDLRFGAAGSALLVDGEPISASPMEKSFVEMLSHSHIASIHFSANIIQEDFIQFVQAFAAAGPGLEGLSRQLKEIFQDRAAAIHVNEVHFVALEDPEMDDTRVGNPLAAAASDLKKPSGNGAAGASDTAEAVQLLRLLGTIGEMLANPNATINFGRLREQLAVLSHATRAQLPQVSAGLGGSESARGRLLDLAERLAACFAQMAQGSRAGIH